MDEIVDWAEVEGRPDIVKEAAKQRLRLLKILETYKSDQRISNASYLVDYPLAAKESSIEYQDEVLSSLSRELQMEANRIENALDSIGSLSDTLNAGGNLAAQMDLEYLQSELGDLRSRLSRFRHWVTVKSPPEPASNIDRWSDMSGYGMSDIVLEGRKERLERINNLQQNITSINQILEQRRQELEAQMKEFEQRLLELQEEFLAKKIEYEKQERQTYFDLIYFDTKEREEEEWDDRLRHLIEP